MNNLNKRIMHDILVKKKVLEIGPYVRPFISSPYVKYVDVLPIEDLLKRAKEQNFPHDEGNIPKKIHYVIDNEDWSCIHEKFDAVFSSHCIEHQMDFIKHLNNVSNVLNPDCSYYLCVPDKRFCFDFYKPITTVGELIDEYNNVNNKSLSFRKYHDILWHTHNDPVQHWSGNHGDVILTSENFATLVEKWKTIKNEYVDLHRHQFTPKSFYINMVLLYNLKYTDLFPLVVTETEKNSYEFYVQLIKNDHIETYIEFSAQEYFNG